MSGIIDIKGAPQIFPQLLCEVCFEKCTIIGTERDCEDDEPHIIQHYFCQRHYDNWRNNEIEIPAERLEVLKP